MLLIPIDSGFRDPQAQLHRPLFSDSSDIKELDQRRPGRYHEQRGHLFSREIKSNAAIPQARATAQNSETLGRGVSLMPGCCKDEDDACHGASMICPDSVGIVSKH